MAYITSYKYVATLFYYYSNATWPPDNDAPDSSINSHLVSIIICEADALVVTSSQNPTKTTAWN